MQLKEQAIKYKNKILFYIQEVNKEFMAKHKVKSNAFFMIHDTDKSKYRFEREINETVHIHKLGPFIDQFTIKNLTKYIRSAERNIQDELENSVFPLVGSNFEKIVLDPKKAVFVRIYDKMLQRNDDKFLERKEWLNLAKHYKTKRDKILISEIDISDNDLPYELEKFISPNSHNIFAFPIGENKNWTKQAPNNTEYKFNDTMNFKNLDNFIQKHTGGNIKKTDL